MFSILKQLFADLIFPKKCVICERLGGYLCVSCLEEGVRVEKQSCPRCNKLMPAGKYCSRCRRSDPLGGVLAFGYFKSEPIKKLVHEFKYGGIFDIAEMMAGLMSELIGSSGVPFDLIAYVPQSRKRRIWRGYNQSEILARHISQRTGKPLFTGLKKIKETETQVGLTKKKRELNLKGAFAVEPSASLKGKKIILIDDVKTTGATLSVVASVLKDCGAQRIHAVVFAKE